jgi:hypothetical protein
MDDDAKKMIPHVGTIQTRQRKYDGLHAAWRYEPSQDRASPWVCVAVEETREAAFHAALHANKSA